MKARANILWILMPLVAGLPALRATAADSALDASPLEEPTQPLVRKEPRSEAAEDRLHAASLYATGRVMFQRGDLAGALRQYQRAWRWDRQARTILPDIVALSFSLGRHEEAVRYALVSADAGQIDPLLVRRLALYVTESGDWERAVRLYRQWLSHPDAQLDDDPLGQLLVKLEIGRLEFLAGNAAEASASLAEVEAALTATGEDSELAEQLRKALGDDLNATWELCALAHAEAEQFDLAAATLDRIDLPLDETGRLGYQQAQAALAQGDPLRAWDYLREYFQAGWMVEGRRPYELLGQILSQLNQGEALVVELAKLRAADRENAALALALAEELQRQGQPEQAEALYREVIASEQQIPGKVLAPAIQALVLQYSEQGNARALLDVIRTAAQRLDDPADLQSALAEIPRHVGLVDRLVDLAQRTDLSEASTEQSLAVAALLIGAERYDEANRFFAAAISAEPDHAADLTLAWGLGLYEAEQYEAAAQVFHKGAAEKLLPEDDPTFPYYESVCLEMSGHTDEALAVARQLAAAHPDSAEYAGREAWILYHAERDQQAIAAYKELIGKFDEQYDSATRSELHDARLILSSLEHQDDDTSAAEEWLQQILDEYPEDVGAMNDLGYLWADAGKHLRQARQLIEQAVADDPQNAAYHDSLGWVLYRQGEHQAAIEALEAAVRLSRNETGDQADPVVLDHLGDAYLHGGRLQDAIRQWQLALGEFTDEQPDQAAAVREKLRQHGGAVPDSSQQQEVQPRNALGE